MMILETRYTIELLDRENNLLDEIITHDESAYENILYSIFDDMNVETVHITKTDIYDCFYSETSYKTIAA